MRFCRSSLLWLGGVLLASSLLGCGSDGPPTATVNGTVTMGGKPVDGAGVMIQPDGGGTPATATTDASGKFEVKSLIGPSKVGITKTKTTGAGTQSVKNEEGVDVSGDFTQVKTEFLTPVKYASPMTSGLTLEVKKGMEPVTFDLGSK